MAWSFPCLSNSPSLERWATKWGDSVIVESNPSVAVCTPDLASDLIDSTLVKYNNNRAKATNAALILGVVACVRQLSRQRTNKQSCTHNALSQLETSMKFFDFQLRQLEVLNFS